jgi:hypothetical protein
MEWMRGGGGLAHQSGLDVVIHGIFVEKRESAPLNSSGHLPLHSLAHSHTQLPTVKMQEEEYSDQSQ